jgi:hypothetical protein
MKPLAVEQTASSQPFPLDANGTLTVDLLGIDESSQTLKLWKNQWAGSQAPATPFNL